jgi:hypothetical protein
MGGSGINGGGAFHSTVRTSISGPVLGGRKPVSGRFSVRSDSLHRHNVLCKAAISWDLHARIFFLPLIEVRACVYVLKGSGSLLQVYQILEGAESDTLRTD